MQTRRAGLDWELTLISFDHAVGERAAKVCKKRMRTPVEVRERIGYSPMGSVEARDCLMRASFRQTPSSRDRIASNRMIPLGDPRCLHQSAGPVIPVPDVDDVQ